MTSLFIRLSMLFIVLLGAACGETTRATATDAGTADKADGGRVGVENDAGQEQANPQAVSCAPDLLLRFTLVCDVESTDDLLLMASYFLGGEEPVSIELFVSGPGGKEFSKHHLPIEVFRSFMSVGSYVDEDGVEIFIWRYVIPAPACEVVSAFCGAALCEGKKLELDFNGESVTWYIVLKHDVCMLVMKE